VGSERHIIFDLGKARKAFSLGPARDMYHSFSRQGGILDTYLDKLEGCHGLFQKQQTIFGGKKVGDI
jgi:hypothetical protein